MAYDSIMSNFAELETVCAPEGFEAAVMQKIAEMPRISQKVAGSIENIICMVWGSISVLFGIGFLAVINSGRILEYFYNTPELSGYADIMMSVSNYVTNFTISFTDLINSSAVTVFGYLSSSRYVLLIIFGVLAVTQYILFRRGKVGA